MAWRAVCGFVLRIFSILDARGLHTFSLSVFIVMYSGDFSGPANLPRGYCFLRLVNIDEVLDIQDMRRPTYPYLALSTITALEPAARRRGVSEVARSPRGFLAVYRGAKGDWRRLSEDWIAKRDGFIARHLAQLEGRGEALIDPDGMPTRRHLALIMWAYSPLSKPTIRQIVAASRALP